MDLLDVHPFMQTDSGLCGPACVKMILDYHGVAASEREIAKIARTSRKNGTSAQNLVRAAKHYGCDAFIQDSSTIADIRRYVRKERIPVIVDFFEKDDGHYSVVIGIDTENIYLQNPGMGQCHAIAIKDFRRIWFDFDSLYPNHKEDFILQRLIVITKHIDTTRTDVRKIVDRTGKTATGI